MMNSIILDYVSDLLGPNVLNIMTHLFYKRSQDERRVSWHQDASYWPLTPTKTVTVWLALDDVSEQNGAMKFIPGSHRHGQIPFQKSDLQEHNVLNQTVTDPQGWGESAVSVELKAGQISIHSDLLLHGSEPNLSTTDRRGLTLRYMPSDVQCIDSSFGKNRRAFQCLGKNPEKYWSVLPPPIGEAIPLKLESPL
ncbi:MAG: phytanoyl-CoA dioxygenase family protein [bacterium]